MNKLKVISEKYNDEDVLQVKNLSEEVNKEIEAGKIIVPEGLELIEWDGNRDFTEEEVAKLVSGKIGVKEIHDYETMLESTIYLPTYIYDAGDVISIRLNCYDVGDDGLLYGTVGVLIINEDGSFDLFSYAFDNELPFGTKLFKHSILLSSGFEFYFTSTRAGDYTNISDLVLDYESGCILGATVYDPAEDAVQGNLLSLSVSVFTYYESTGGQIVNESITSVSITSDTVTPL